jgi:hypothetical protein
MTGRGQDYKWLENHINSAVEEVKNWPEWKSQGSTLASNKDIVGENEGGSCPTPGNTERK